MRLGCAPRQSRRSGGRGRGRGPTVGDGPGEGVGVGGACIADVCFAVGDVDEFEVTTD